MPQSEICHFILALREHLQYQ